MLKDERKIKIKEKKRHFVQSFLSKFLCLISISERNKILQINLGQTVKIIVFKCQQNVTVFNYNM